MSEEKTTGTFEQWAIVEIMGHNQIAGLVTEVSAFGTALMRVDVPAVNGSEAYTKYFGGDAIYAITPTTQEIATEAARRLDVRPVSLWVIPDPKPQLPPTTYDSNIDEYDYHDGEDDDGEDDDDDGIDF